MTVDRRRIIVPFAVFALVLMRLVIGWHFFGEGAKKLQYDRHDRQFHLAFSADDFLGVAKGPLADWYFAYTPDEHNWRQLLAKPNQNVRPTPEETAERAKWQHDYNDRRTATTKKGESASVEFPPSAAYHDWAAKIADDWRATADKVKSVSRLTEAQKQQVDKALNARLEALADYLAGEDETITTYRHELWRLANWRNAPEGGGVPFYQQRIAAKQSETTGQLKPWLAQVQTLDAGYLADLDRILTTEQRAEPATADSVRTALVDTQEARLNKLNIVVTILTTGVGVCLLLGFFTRLASLAGAIFLLGVIASQPFWISDAAPTINQCIECAGLLVLAGTRAGRWLGLDYFTFALFHRNRRLETL
jgi:uncharacterized membrane protein YphA (DoxX/SURF4 family)